MDESPIRVTVDEARAWMQDNGWTASPDKPKDADYEWHRMEWCHIVFVAGTGHIQSFRVLCYVPSEEVDRQRCNFRMRIEVYGVCSDYMFATLSADLFADDPGLTLEQFGERLNGHCNRLLKAWVACQPERP